MRQYLVEILLVVLIAVASIAAVGDDNGSKQVMSAFICASNAVDAALVDRKGAEAAFTYCVRTTGRGVPIVVYNSLAWNRTDVVDCPSPFPPENAVVSIRDESGQLFSGQILGDRLIFTARDVPSVGYRVFWATRSTPLKGTGVSGNGFAVENQFFRVTIDPVKGAISSIFDKVSGRELVDKNRLSATVEFGASCDPNGDSTLRYQELVGNTEVVLMENGPARARLTWDHYFGTSQVNIDAVISDGVPRLDIAVTLDWQEEPLPGGIGPSLRLLFPFAVESSAVNAGLFDSNQVVDVNGLTGAVVRWIDISCPGYGVSVLTDFGSLQNWSGNAVATTLVGSVAQAFRLSSPQVGTYEMRMSIYPHKADWRIAGTAKRAFEIANPLLAVLADTHEGKLPSSGSFMSLSGGTAVISKATLLDDGETFEVTLAEIQGERSSLNVKLKPLYRTYREIIGVEASTISTKPIVNGLIPVTLAPGESKTVRLSR